MPRFDAVVSVMLKPAILDPQGRAVRATLERLGHDNIADLRVGKRIALTLEGERDAVEAQLREIADGLLANPVMEDYRISLTERRDEREGA